MMKKFFAMFSILGACASVNAQNVQVAQSTLDILEKSTAVSPKTDRGCLDFRTRPDGSEEIVNCAGWYLTAGAGASSLKWSNNDGEEDTPLAITYKTSVGYRFMHYDWICALRVQADAYANGPTRVEGLRQGFTAGFGGTILAEFNPHGGVRFDLGPTVKTRNLTSQKTVITANGNSDTDKYGGNVVLYGVQAGVNIPLLKVFSTSSSLVNGRTYKVHRGTSISLDIHASYMMGSIQKKWVDESHTVDFKETGVTAGLLVKF